MARVKNATVNKTNSVINIKLINAQSKKKSTTRNILRPCNWFAFSEQKIQE